MVAENVDDGFIDLQTLGTSWYWTFRMTGVAAPETLGDGIKALNAKQQPVSVAIGEKIDIYIWPTNQDANFVVSLPGADPD